MDLKDTELRFRLTELLTKSQAHMGLEGAVKDFPMERINDKFPNGEYSAWGLLEHMRLTQNDIWEFMDNPKYVEPEWPKDYWPDTKTTATPEMWEKSLEGFRSDLQKLVDLVNNPRTDLSAKVANGNGQTILREILVVADHNAYHTGEFAIMRQVMGTWGKNH